MTVGQLHLEALFFSFVARALFSLLWSDKDSFYQGLAGRLVRNLRRSSKPVEIKPVTWCTKS